MHLVDLKMDVAKVLTTLTYREEKVLIMFFGLDGQGSMSIVDIALELNRSTTVIRGVMNKALIKMRHKSRISKIV